VKRLGFRARLFLILLSFAVVPSVALTLVWGGTISKVLPLVGTSTAWDSVAASGERALSAVRSVPLSTEQEGALREHELELRESLLQAKRLGYLASRSAEIVVAAALVGVLFFVVLASRVAGHLSRQLSRPIHELVGWTDRIGHGVPLPESALKRGAPEFEVLRQRMREMSRDLERGREQALEAERAAAFRETARRVAHELKNPLTPIRFAIERLRREVQPAMAETVDVLATETQRLEDMARSFAQFGRLPEGPAADVDVGELVRYTARTIGARVPVAVDVEEGLPMVRGHHDALARALSNVLLNAVEACQEGGEVAVRAHRAGADGRDSVVISVEDTGCGIAADRLARIWDPYVTYKRGGTGLGLAIARQTIVAHAGEVDATSAPGKGTRIRFILPADAVPAVGGDNGHPGT
jgi:signal transduction histidine kinase